MRVIKFRAWRNCSSSGFFKEPRFTLEDIACNIDDIGDNICNKADIVWEQFTGLTDIKGMEIYEGDIVHYVYDCKTAWASDSIAVIDWRSTGFHMNPIKGNGCVQGWLVSIPHGDGKLFEVIGNIHENAELLKEPPCQA